MMIWDILEKKITDAGIAVSGTTMFRQFMPATIRIGVMLKMPLTGVAIDPYLPGYYKPLLQVIVRHTDAQEGEAMAQAVMEALTINKAEFYDANDEHGAVQIMKFYPRELPIRFPRLDGNELEWSLNFETAFTMAK